MMYNWTPLEIHTPDLSVTLERIEGPLKVTSWAPTAGLSPWVGGEFTSQSIVAHIPKNPYVTPGVEIVEVERVTGYSLNDPVELQEETILGLISKDFFRITARFHRDTFPEFETDIMPFVATPNVVMGNSSLYSPVQDTYFQGESGYHLAEKVRETFTDTVDHVNAYCPDGCPGARALWDLIQHLNDVHQWSREKIATWLEDTGNNPEFPVPETVPKEPGEE